VVISTNVILGIPAIPPVVTEDRALNATVDALKEAVEILSGSRGNPNSRALTVGEATEGGTTDLFVTNRVVETIGNVASTVTLSGDVEGSGDFDENDGEAIIATNITLPNIVVINGGASDTDYTGAAAGPYGIEGAPAGGITGQVLGKQSDTDGDFAWINQIAAPALPTTVWAPGYNYTYQSGSTFTVDLVDVQVQFKIGKRLKFESSTGVETWGTITAVDFDTTHADDTFVTVTMESGAVPNPLAEVYFASSAVAWVGIAEDPMSGGPVADITTGVISSTQWWVIVGEDGKLYTSTDGGASWTARVSGTTGDLHACVYDSANDTFWIGGEDSTATGSYLAKSTDGITWTDTTIPWTNAAGDFVNMIAYCADTDYLIASYYDASETEYKYTVSDDEWVTEEYRDFQSSAPSFCAAPARAGDTPNDWYSTTDNQTVEVYTSFSDTSGSTHRSLSGGHTISGHRRITIPSTPYSAQTFIGATDGQIDHIHGSWYTDTTTFAEAINDFAHSRVSGRLVCVGDSGQIGYVNDANLGGNDAWTVAPNGFDVSANVTRVEYNETDALFIAVADNGQICRSSNGIT